VIGAGLAGCGGTPAALRGAAAPGTATSATVASASATLMGLVGGGPGALQSVSVSAAPAVPASGPAATYWYRLRGCVAVARHLRQANRPMAARAALMRCAREYRLLRQRLRLRLTRLLASGLHGTITVSTASGVRTLAFERGVIQSASATSVVVKAADGTTWTWTIGSATVITRAGHAVAAGSLASGQQVLAAGPVVSGADDARRIFVAG